MYALMMLMEEDHMPDAKEAFAAGLALLEKLKPRGIPFTVIESPHMPKSGLPWEINQTFDLSHPALPPVQGLTESIYANLGYISAGSHGRGQFFLHFLIPEISDIQLWWHMVDERSYLLLDCVDIWLATRSVAIGMIVSNEALPKAKDTIGMSFPRSVGWWTWVNSEIVDKAGKTPLLNADIWKAAQREGGIEWQLTEKMSDINDPQVQAHLRNISFKGSKIKVLRWNTNDQSKRSKYQ